MFSGVLTHHGLVGEHRRHENGGTLLEVIAPAAIAEGVAHGDSVAIDGACLTVVTFDDQMMRFEVVPETVTRTTLGALTSGTRVNLELSLRLGDRLGGHLVYAHVDTTIRLLDRVVEGQGYRLTFERPAPYATAILEKGYVALDGVSLTVASIASDTFTVAVIPETAALTTLGIKPIGARVNLELDPIARYTTASVAQYLTTRTV